MEETVKKPDLVQLTERVVKRTKEDVKKLDPQTKEKIEIVRCVWDFLAEIAIMIEDELGSVGEVRWVFSDGLFDYFSIKIATAEVVVHIPGASFSGPEGNNLYTIEKIHVKEVEEIQRLLEVIDQKGIPMQYII